MHFNSYLIIYIFFFWGGRIMDALIFHFREEVGVYG